MTTYDHWTAETEKRQAAERLAAFDLQIGKIDLKSDDIVVLKINESVSQRAIDALSRYAKQVFGETRKIAVFFGDVELSIVSPNMHVSNESAPETHMSWLNTASGYFLDIIGAERNLTRNPGEPDTEYRQRIALTPIWP